MDAGHGLAAHRHSAGDGRDPGGRHRIGPALALTWGFAAVEGAGGLWAGSLALLADAGHMFTDGAALGVALLAAWLAGRAPSARHTYGMGRAEFLGALFNALAMLAVVFGIGLEAWARFESPKPVQGAAVVAVASVGLLVNLGVAAMLARGLENLNVRGAFLHVVGDILGSVAAIVAGLVVWATGWTPIDPLLSLLICGLVMAASVRLLHDSVQGLLDAVPLSVSLPDLGRALASVPGVVDVHDLHVWSLSGERMALSAHVRVRSFERWPEMLRELQRLVRERGIEHATFQPEEAPRVTFWRRT